MAMPDRKYNQGDYRFGFNGKEQDPETYGTGNIYDYGFRIYNPRIAKFLSVDPLFKSYPWYTPYQFAGNKPIAAVDLDGLEEKLTIYFTEIGFEDEVGRPVQFAVTFENVDYERRKQIAHQYLLPASFYEDSEQFNNTGEVAISSDYQSGGSSITNVLWTSEPDDQTYVEYSYQSGCCGHGQNIDVHGSFTGFELGQDFGEGLYAVYDQENNYINLYKEGEGWINAQEYMSRFEDWIYNNVDDEEVKKLLEGFGGAIPEVKGGDDNDKIPTGAYSRDHKWPNRSLEIADKDGSRWKKGDTILRLESKSKKYHMPQKASKMDKLILKFKEE
jgi:RHS repeat-associated protein